MQNTEIIKLEYPVQLADGEMTEVTMRRPLMKDMVKHNIGEDFDLKKAISLCADLCELKVEDIHLFDAGDYEKLQEQLLRFRVPHKGK